MNENPETVSTIYSHTNKKKDKKLKLKFRYS